MNQQRTRQAITANSSRKLQRVKQNHKTRDYKKPHLAKHGLKGTHHGSGRNPS